MPNDNIKRVEFHIAYDCANACVFCSESEQLSKYKGEFVSLDDFRANLCELEEYPIEHITLTGGEPSLNTELKEILKLSKEKGSKTYITTNGGNFSDPKYSQMHLPLLDEICFSVHGHNEYLHDSICGRRRAHANLIKAIMNVKSYAGHIKVYANIVVSKMNINDIESIIGFLSEWDLFSQVLISNVAPEGRGSSDYQKLAIRHDELDKRLDGIVKRAEAGGIALRFFGWPLCALGDYIEYSNDLWFSPRITIEKWNDGQGEYYKKTVSYKPTRGRIKPEPCVKCCERDRCGGLFREYEKLYGYSELKPIQANQQTIEDNLPYELLRLGTRCNARCTFCNVPAESAKYPELDLFAAKKEIDQLIQKNGDKTRLSISGGEPTLHPDLAAIVAYAKEKNIRTVEVQTNGFYFSDNGYTGKLKEVGLDKAFVSLHSFVPETHDIMLGVKGAFDQVREGIRNLITHNVEVTLNPVLTELNYRDIAEYIDLVAKEYPAIKFISLSVVQPRGRAGKNIYLLPRYSDISPYVEQALVNAKKRNIIVNNPYCGLPLCIGSWYKYKYQNVEYSESKVVENFQSIDKEKVQGPECARCNLRNACRGVWKEYAQRYGFGDLTAISD